VDSSNPSEWCRRLLGLLRNLPRRAGVDEIHRLRTSVRRLEAQLEMPRAGDDAGLFRCPPKVARALRALRKKAGGVRDVDVHLALLSDPLFGSRHVRRLRAPLARRLRAERATHLEALRECARRVQPRLERKLPELVTPAEVSADVAAAIRLSAQVRRRFLELSQPIPEDAARLHRLRIDAKHLRYGLEPYDGFVEAERLLAQLRKVQQAIGEWHDWATLHELALSTFTEATRTEATRTEAAAEEFLALLEQRTAREFTRACRAVRRARLRMIALDGDIPLPATPAHQQTLIKAG
jgi:CHAD domain-containing protein